MAIQTELVRGIDGRPNDQPGSAALHGQAHGRKNNRGQCEPRFADLAARHDHSDDPRSGRANLERDPEKWEPVFGKRSCSNKKLDHDPDSTRSDHGLSAFLRTRQRPHFTGHRPAGRRTIALLFGKSDQQGAQDALCREARMSISKQPALTQIEGVAGNGLINRRALLGRGIAFAGATTAGASATFTSAGAEPLPVDPWSLTTGSPIPAYETPSKYEKHVVRTLTNPNHEPRTSNARTPHHLLNGTITPNGLHFVIARAGFPDIDPAKHRLVIHGLVKEPKVFTLETLARYPMESRICFVECGGNSGPLYNKDPVQANVQAIHGLVSCSEWTGVRLSTLLEETGIDPKAKWFLAEGADAPSMNRSIP